MKLSVFLIWSQCLYFENEWNSQWQNQLIGVFWHKQVSLKVTLFVWRLLHYRLSIKDNLVRRQILLNDENVCVGGCGSLKDAGHLFLGCAFFTGTWTLVLQWLRLSFVAPATIHDHLLQFSHLVGFLRSSHSFFKIIWLACV